MRKITLEDGSIRYEVMEQLLTEEEFDAAFAPEAPDTSSLTGWKKPLHSDALAVHGKQVGEATEDSRKKGVPTDFDRQGRPIFTSAAHRKKYCQAYGFFDKNAGYGDAARGSCKRDVPPPPSTEELSKMYFG